MCVLYRDMYESVSVSQWIEKLLHCAGCEDLCVKGRIGWKGYRRDAYAGREELICSCLDEMCVCLFDLIWIPLLSYRRRTVTSHADKTHHQRPST